MKVDKLASLLIVLILLYSSCTRQSDDAAPLFKLINDAETGISFRNDLPFNSEFNIFTYRNFYNGGGVAIGDINNDGLADIYFTSNLGPNALYLNKGNFTFENITEKAGVAGKQAWSTGVVMADVNGDGWLDIYVCNSGDIKNDNRENELFINNGDLTFTESAAVWGLNDKGFSTHAAFFDYDNDGDLDVYLLNNSFKAIGSFNLMQNIRHERDSVGGDKLYRNDGNRFTDVSIVAGIYGSVIGFGLGVTVGDVNNDGWMDIFISNDFFERDYLYLNNRNGTFSEILEQAMPSISAASMGADMADINNDGWMDIFVTDMLPEQYERLKQVTIFENWDKLTYNVRNGYYYQFTRNMLHLNNGNNTFSDISRLGGVEATDWSWGALIFDMDNDGLKDIFVANGIYKDITDLDYLNFIDKPETKQKIINRQRVDYQALIDPIPVNPVPNYAFKNLGGYRFDNHALPWGLGAPSHSNGAAYGDLDNDGDLDLVVNNVNSQAFVFRNTTNDTPGSPNYIRIILKGKSPNTWAVGSRIQIFAGGSLYTFEQMPNRGFESSVDPVIVAGLGSNKFIDTLRVEWPGGSETVLTNIHTNQTITLNHEEAKEKSTEKPDHKLAWFTEATKSGILAAVHHENEFIDFNRDRLLYQMYSTLGPRVAVGDVNNDGLDDFYLGGAKGYAGQLMVQKPDGNFAHQFVPAFESDKSFEDVDAVFFDLNNDDALDLFVVSGGNEFSFGSPELVNRVYLNNGRGEFSRSPQPALNNATVVYSTVAAGDFNQDGFTDLFVGTRFKAFQYGVPAGGYIYQNDGTGRLVNVTRQVAPELADVGMITDSEWADYDSDGDLDLILVGEWMSIEIFQNQEGTLIRKTTKLGITNLSGWWNVLEAVDLDKDGDVDFVLGNHGYNSRFRASVKEPVLLYVNDFDSNGSTEHIYAKKSGGRILPYALKHDLVAQLPSLKKNYLEYRKFNNQTVEEIFTKEQLSSAVVHQVVQLASGVLENVNGQFVFHELPIEAQFSPVHAILVTDVNDDGITDLVLGGNLYQVKPEAGQYDASYGLVLFGKGNLKFTPLSPTLSGFQVRGAVRDISQIKTPAGIVTLVALNNDSLRVFVRNRQ
ncbi:MAG: VCBS repeat-containing protein [Cyclobacteriaceae bacterium]|nr:VCBS repeat-containing protein [Cyclobacteriaceae bacterium]